MKIFATNLVVFLLIYLARGDPAVIIIGAGPAGIAAAAKLLENNFRNVLILEAENRIGGRVNSVMFGEAFVDLGAEWCHGETDNYVFNMVKDFHILEHTELPHAIYHSSGQYLDEEFSKTLLNIVDGIYSADGHRNVEEGITLGSYCIERFNRTVEEKFGANLKQLKVAKSSIDLFQHVVLSSEGSFCWFEPSALSDYKDCEGDLNLNWNGLGYKTALEVLMKKFPDPSKQLPFDHIVLLNKEVTRVLWNESSTESGVSVQCSDKSSYVADHLIFTPSVGVLKDRHGWMFEPPLPQRKNEAIRHIGIGAVMKVAVSFRKRWWDVGNFTGIYLVWNEEDKSKVLKQFPQHPSKDGRLWLTQLFSILPAEHNPNVLICWFSGDLVPQIEQLSNRTLINGLVFVMHKFLGSHYNVSEPDALIRSNWYSNPHFRGTYSYETVESRKHKISPHLELAQPLVNIEGRPIVQFAGEASHPYFYSTVHGAIETGIREADRIINLYKFNKLKRTL